MDDRTVHALNAINQHFYRENAEEFDATRSGPWPGWARLLEHVDPSAASPFRVLDIGCGNGRFAAFLADAWIAARNRVDYTGIDSSATLLASAHERGLALGAVEWMKADIVQPDHALGPLDRTGPFSLIAMFGILHHVPSAARRSDLLRLLGTRLQPDGLLVLTSWQFEAFARFRDKIVAWEEYNHTAAQPIDIDQLEHGDYLLPWSLRNDVHRYCHFASQQESETLLQRSGFLAVDSYRADGREGELNHYFICRVNDAQPAPKAGVPVRRKLFSS